MARAQRSLVVDLIRRALPQTLLIMAIGALAGFAVNSRRADPLPLDLPGFLLLPESGAPAVFPSAARELFAEAEYVFVDARPEQEYIAEHISDALSMPLGRFQELLPELRMWTAGQPILVYGSQRDFVTVDDLARRLHEAGESEVKLMIPGIEAWSARGYPVQRGRQGLLIEELEDWPE
jgi:rhodanese-related sulfurtransferase